LRIKIRPAKRLLASSLVESSLAVCTAHAFSKKRSTGLNTSGSRKFYPWGCAVW
jgi:hypothetical protein